jgi:hypothetical protein
MPAIINRIEKFFPELKMDAIDNNTLLNTSKPLFGLIISVS